MILVILGTEKEMDGLGMGLGRTGEIPYIQPNASCLFPCINALVERFIRLGVVPVVTPMPTRRPPERVGRPQILLQISVYSTQT